MSTQEVSNTLGEGRAFTGVDQIKVKHQPRLRSDNSPCYIANELSEYLKAKDMTHTRGVPYHPQTQGQIGRWHRPIKNQILLENYYPAGELKTALQRFVDCCNHERYHEARNNRTPAAVFCSRGLEILGQREERKRNTLAMQRKMHYDNQASNEPDGLTCLISGHHLAKRVRRRTPDLYSSQMAWMSRR